MARSAWTASPCPKWQQANSECSRSRGPALRGPSPRRPEVEGGIHLANRVVTRLQADRTLAPADLQTFYTPGEQGYTDYPA